MKNTIQKIRDDLYAHDKGLISSCALITQARSHLAAVDPAAFEAALLKELEDATETLVCLMGFTDNVRERILSAIKSLRDSGYYVSHTEKCVFYCVSPRGSFGATNRTESVDPRMFLDLWNEHTGEEWKE